VQSIPISASPDLIVANRVLQHIVDEGEFRQINYFTSMARHVYINEPEVKEADSLGEFLFEGRDYIQILADLGCRLVQEGELTAEYGGRQRMDAVWEVKLRRK
jgi:hypothetical protein